MNRDPTDRIVLVPDPSRLLSRETRIRRYRLARLERTLAFEGDAWVSVPNASAGAGRRPGR
jgi:hypothetical protein